MRQLRENPDGAQPWEDFVAVYGPRIDSWCRRRGLQESDVQDVTQNVLLKLAKHFGTFEYDPSKGFRKWLRTVTENALRDFAKSSARQPSTSADEILQAMETRRELLNHMSEAFDLEVLSLARSRVQSQVEPSHWRVFELTTDQAMPGSRVAEETGQSVANVYKIKSRIQQQLREEIHALNGED